MIPVWAFRFQSRGRPYSDSIETAVHFAVHARTNRPHGTVLPFQIGWLLCSETVEVTGRIMETHFGHMQRDTRKMLSAEGGIGPLARRSTACELRPLNTIINSVQWLSSKGHFNEDKSRGGIDPLIVVDASGSIRR